jgi:hypothetical protein
MKAFPASILHHLGIGVPSAVFRAEFAQLSDELLTFIVVAAGNNYSRSLPRER